MIEWHPLSPRGQYEFGHGSPSSRMIGALPAEPSTIDSAMATLAALVLAAFLTAIAALHFNWAVGGRWGVTLAIPTSADGVHALFEPGRIGTAIVGALLLAGAAVAMGRLLPAWDVVLLRLMAVVFTLRAVTSGTWDS